MTEFGAIVLCGGGSRRMGQPKEWLQFGDEYLLQRIVRIVSEVCSPVVVVRSVQQALPPLPSSIIVVEDDRPNGGPLAGLERGLKELEVEKLFLVSCDVPLISAETVRHVCEGLQVDRDVVLPESGGKRHPLFAAYRRCLLPGLTTFMDTGERKMMTFLAQQRVKLIHDLPEHVLRNTNTPAEYAEVLEIAEKAGLTSASRLPLASDS